MIQIQQWFFLLIFLCCMAQRGLAFEVPIEPFPIDAYSQKVQDYLSPQAPDYTHTLLKKSYQEQQLKLFFRHYYATDAHGLSPWSEGMVRSILPYVRKNQLALLDAFDNQKQDELHLHYGENYKTHHDDWLEALRRNINIGQMHLLHYQASNRAIAVNNTRARALPTDTPDFFHITHAGQGYPFDNLQESAIWAGTPLYVIHVSNDKAWSLVLTPDVYFAWVNTQDIAYVSSDFIHRWQMAAQDGMVAITKTQASVFNRQQQYQFTGFIGAVFPKAASQSFYIPVKQQNGLAKMVEAYTEPNGAHVMPLIATKKAFASLLKQLQNRPYGWGGAYFYNDCSQEIKSLMAPFGIWLPRNSALQIKYSLKKDLSSMSEQERIEQLKEKGHPLMTIIYIGGHVMLYVGTINTSNAQLEAITYQNVWGLTPSDRMKRYIIGQSLFFPLRLSYPEQPDVVSMASKPEFKLGFLDELDHILSTPKETAQWFLSEG